jgi:N-acetyl-gamma-glutamyl-phosphate reductase
MAERVAIVGARGYVGSELIGLLNHHPGFETRAVGSRSRAGQMVSDVVPVGESDLRYQTITAESVSDIEADIWVLGLPNGMAAPFVEAIEESNAQAKIVDLSSDYRGADGWTYGLTEHNRDSIKGASRVANPGCYATGIQLGLHPLLDSIAGEPIAFGVSGYSGAGTKPSPKNDLHRLRDNLLPYKLCGHGHQKEISYFLGRPARLIPHVAPFFRGISLTLSIELTEASSIVALQERLEAAYQDEPLVRVQEEIPEVRDIVFRHHAALGGLALDPSLKRLNMVVVLDNLLKGAATQALQNMNLMCGFQEREAILT